MIQPTKISVASKNTGVSMTVSYSCVKDIYQIREDLLEMLDSIETGVLSHGLIDKDMPNLHLIEDRLADIEAEYDLLRQSTTFDGGYCEPSLKLTFKEYSYYTYHNPDGNPYNVMGTAHAVIRRNNAFCTNGMFQLNKNSEGFAAQKISEAVPGSTAVAANLYSKIPGYFYKEAIKPDSTPKSWPFIQLS